MYDNGLVITSGCSLSPDEEAEFVSCQFWDLLRQRPIQEVLLLQAYFLSNKRPVAELAKQFSLTPETAVRKLAEIEAAYRTLRDLRQPPHAAD